MLDDMFSTWMSASNKKGERILVVDDDEMIRLYLESLLAENGYRVVTASGFDEAKLALSRQQFDLLISDLVFFEKPYSGLDIVQYTKSHFSACKVMILTSYPSTHTAVASLRMNAVDYLSKPVSKEDMLAAVSNAFIGRAIVKSKDSTESTSVALSKKEREVLLQLFKGHSFVEASRNMGCSVSTTKTYSQRIYKKLRVNSRSEAIHEALNMGLIKHH